MKPKPKPEQKRNVEQFLASFLLAVRAFWTILTDSTYVYYDKVDGEICGPAEDTHKGITVLTKKWNEAATKERQRVKDREAAFRSNMQIIQFSNN